MSFSDVQIYLSFDALDALSAVPTPVETVWGFRASDIYQGGETEPPSADRAVPAVFKSLDNDPKKTTIR